jgi:hypothetical protein
MTTTGCRLPPPPPPFHNAREGKNHLNEEITPLLPARIGGQEQYSQTIPNLEQAALLRRCELPL